MRQLDADNIWLWDLENNHIPHDIDPANMYSLMKAGLQSEGFSDPLTVYAVCANDVLTKGAVVIDGSVLKGINFHRIQGS